MLNSKMTEHTLYKPVISKNDYNEEVRTYSPYLTVGMVISYNTKNQYRANDANLMSCEYIAYSNSKEIVKGMRVDNRYTVEFVVETNLGVYAMLSEVENNGRISV